MKKVYWKPNLRFKMRDNILLILAAVFATGCGSVPRGTVVTRAGQTAIIPCGGLVEPGGIINQLHWSCVLPSLCPAADRTGRLVEYSAGSVHVLGDTGRVSLDERSWSLHLTPVEATDAAIYSCVVNGKSGDQRLVRLTVLDVPSAPGRPVVLQFFSREVQLSWVPSFQANNSPIQYYIVQTRQGEEGEWPPLEDGLRTVDNVTTSATVTGLTPFSVYTFRVVAVNALGASEPSPTSYPIHTIRERPGAAPRFITVTNVTSSSVQLNWEPPAASSLHGEFIYYRLTYRTAADPGRAPQELLLHDQLQTAYPPIRMLTCLKRYLLLKALNYLEAVYGGGFLFLFQTYVLEGLQPYTSYQISLQVKNPKALGPAASITASTAEGVPSRPENVTVAEVNDRSLTVTWLPPRQANGVLSSYQVYWTARGAPVGKKKLPGDDTKTYTLTELEPSTAYTVWVTASTGAGEGERSAPVTISTDVSGPGPPDVTNITCPTDSDVRLQWRRPERLFGSVDLYYVLYRYGDRWNFVERVVPVPSDELEYSILLPNLTSKQIYEIRIQGATVSRLDDRKIYKGQHSIPRKVRVERGCEEIQPLSSWGHRPSTTGSAGTGTLAAGAGTGLLLLLLLLAAVSVAAVWRRRRQSDSSAPKRSRSAAGPGWSPPAHEAVPCHLFMQHVHQLHLDDEETLRREWEALQLRAPPAEPPPRGVTMLKQNGVSTGPGTAQHTYGPVPVRLRSRRYRRRAVPAVYAVDGYRRARALYVAQRPAPHEYDALWRLVWEQGVSTVVLIGSLQSYSDRFWPDVGCIRPSVDLQVEGQSEDTLATCVIRNFTISKHKVRCRRSVTLHQFTGWPQHGLPDSRLALLDFVRRSSEQQPDTAGAPVLVISGSPHGAGLSLYVGLSTLLRQLAQSQELAVFSYWHHVIGQSPFLLTTLGEYALLHDCLLERVSSGVTCVPRDMVTHYTEQLMSGRLNSHAFPSAERQYMSAVSLEPHQYVVTSAVKPCNQPKNSCMGLLPTEPGRVCLTPKLNIEGSDYINASWLPGFRHGQEYIVTQHPLPATVLDLWQMLWDTRACTVVCLTPPECGVFWPLEEEEIDCDSFVVRHMSETVSEDAATGQPDVIRSVLMESTEGEEDVAVRLLHMPHWGAHLAPCQLMRAVERVARLQTARRTPLVVIDRHGGTDAAAFCLFSSVLHQLQHEQQVDVYTFAKLYHQRRPGIWRSLTDYVYLYQVVEAWVRASSTPTATTTAGYNSLNRPVMRTSLLMETRIDGMDGVSV